MNERQLRTLLALSERGSFTAAGDAVGLSHSAVSLHIKALEEELGVFLVDRARRPPLLTDRGWAVVERARRLLDLHDEIVALGSDETLAGSLHLGAVPSALGSIVPPALATVRRQHPKLQVRIRVGLSGDLASGVRNGELDAAITTEADRPQDGLRSEVLERERLVVIAPASAHEATEADLLRAHPFIWFSRATWAGQQIERRLLDRGITVRAEIEVESIEAITALVRHGLGVSIVPERRNVPFPPEIRRLPFAGERAERVLVLLERTGNPKARLCRALVEAFRAGATEGNTDRQPIEGPA